MRSSDKLIGWIVSVFLICGAVITITLVLNDRAKLHDERVLCIDNTKTSHVKTSPNISGDTTFIYTPDFSECFQKGAK